jgi:hypothetical protein
VTVVLTADHGNDNLRVGQEIRIFGTTNYNGVFTISEVENQSSFKYSDTTNTGEENAGSAGGHYVNIVDFEANERADLTSFASSKVAELFNDFADGIIHNDQVIFSDANWTTNTENKIKIRSYSSAEQGNPTAHRSGVWVVNENTTFSTTNHENGMFQFDPGLDVEMEGFEIDGGDTGQTNSKRIIQVYSGNGGGSFLFKNLVIHDLLTGTDLIDIDHGDSGSGDTLVQIENCICDTCPDDGISFSNDGTGGFDSTSYVHNTIVYNCTDMGFHSFNGCPVNLRNCYSGGNTDVDFEGTAAWWGDVDNCVSDDTTAATVGDTNAQTSVAPGTAFRDPADHDFRYALESPLISAGTNEVSHTLDIEGNAFGAAFEVGVFSFPFQYDGTFFGTERTYEVIATNDLNTSGFTEASGATYAEDRDWIYILSDSGDLITVRDRNGNRVQDDITLPGSVVTDLEGIAYMGNGEFALLDEGSTGGNPVQIHRTHIAIGETSVSATEIITYDLNDIEVYDDAIAGGVGAEGLAYDRTNEVFYVAVQSMDENEGRLWKVDLSPTDEPEQIPMYYWYDILVSNGHVTNPVWVGDIEFQPQLEDGSGFYAKSLFVLTNNRNEAGGNARKVIQIDLETGTYISEFDHSIAGQSEGLCFDIGVREDMFIAGEQTGGTNFRRYSYTGPTTSSTSTSSTTTLP